MAYHQQVFRPSRHERFAGIFKHMTQDESFTLRAKYIFPIDQPPIEGGCITVAGGKIVEVGQLAAGEVRDLGDVAILPALINAHTHLEFSDLNEPLGERGMIFPDWIREVIRWRAETSDVTDDANGTIDAVRKGIAECNRLGTTTIGEIAPLAMSGTDTYAKMQGIAFFELLGLAPNRQEALKKAAREVRGPALPGRPRNSDGPGEPSHVEHGLSPHAPYTVSLQLVEYAASLSKDKRSPVAMHLAETREELELLRSGTGPFRELLDGLGAWYPDVIPKGTRPRDYLQLLATAHQSLVVHGNYLTSDEIDFVAIHSNNMSVVYCPRTHDYFEHDPYPLSELLDRNVNVTIGTDSRASNPDLNMLNELRFAATQHPSIAPEQLLRMATINAAKALGLSESIGSLSVGKQADFVVLPVASEKTADVHALILNSNKQVQTVFRRGGEVGNR